MKATVADRTGGPGSFHAVLLLILALAAMGAAAGPAPAGGSAPDSAPWQAFLDRYLATDAKDGINRVRYAAVTPEDKARLGRYLEAMQAAKPDSLPPKAQRAFWINLYNARTVASVLAAFPIKSIRDIRLPGSASPGPWEAKLLRVDGQALSLNDIENAILRSRWRDGRIHFALNCASLGCPNLAPRAFSEAGLEAQLDQGARDFLRSPRGAAFEGADLVLSSLFDWYRSDFGGSDKEVREFLARYAPPETAKRLKAHAGGIRYRYDWSLNGI